MIKQLLFTAALLVPGLAYGANPNADLSIQVVPATTAGTCGTIMGQAGTDAAAARFNTCALYNDFTTQIPNTVGTGLPSNWLNCSTTTDTGAVWNWAGGTAPCPGSFKQVTDQGGKVLDLNFNSSYLTAGQYNLDFIGTMPGSGTSTNLGAHSFSNGYYEWTSRWSASAGEFSGNTQGFYSWGQCCGTGTTFVEHDFEEEWPGQNPDWGSNYWVNHVNSGIAFIHYPTMTKENYNTIGYLITGNLANFSVCTYLNGSRVQCNTYPYEAGMDGTQRRQLFLWNGVTCNYDPTIITCAPTNFGNADLYIKNIKVLTCAAEPAGGTCLGNTYNGSFYTP